jgi:hypothetical protein
MLYIANTSNMCYEKGGASLEAPPGKFKDFLLARGIDGGC